MKKACIVMPTYNEAANIAALLPRIYEQSANICTHELHVLVVDDNSPDGTQDVVRELMQQYDKLHMITGEKKGLGEAYIRGISHAIKTLDPEYIFEMDADLQHDPEMLPRLIEEAEKGYDCVIGSRFIEGGVTRFSAFRRILSLVGNFLLRTVGGLPPIADCTSGFRCISAGMLRRCELSNMSSRGYSFQSSLLCELVHHGGRIKEVPIDFAERVNGESKLTLRDQFEFLVNIFRIRLHRSKEFFSYSAINMLGVPVNLATYLLLTRVYGVELEIAAPIAIEISILWNFFMNDSFTFKERRCEAGLFSRLGRFHVAAMAAGVVNYFTFLTLARGVGMWDVSAELVGIAAGFAFNYLLNFKWSWKQAAG